MEGETMPDVEGFQAYLRERLSETGVSMRGLSLAMGRDPAYVAQLLDQRPRRLRALPTPDELRRAAPLLRVSLVDLLDAAYGITRAELEKELGTMAAHTGACAGELAGLTPRQMEEVMSFIAYVRAKSAPTTPDRGGEAGD